MLGTYHVGISKGLRNTTKLFTHDSAFVFYLGTSELEAGRLIIPPQRVFRQKEKRWYLEILRLKLSMIRVFTYWLNYKLPKELDEISLAHRS